MTRQPVLAPVLICNQKCATGILSITLHLLLIHHMGNVTMRDGRVLVPVLYMLQFCQQYD